MFEKLKEKATQAKIAAGTGVGVVVATGAPVLAFAEDGTGGDAMSSMVTSMTSAIQTQVTSIVSAIGGIAPVLFPVAAALVLVGVIYKLFKRFTRG